MPLDSTNYVETKPDLSKPSLEGLAWLLRHEEAWPINHRWQFDFLLTSSHCGTAGCALGLSNLVWGDTRARGQFGMPDDDFKNVFGYTTRLDEYSPFYGKVRSQVSAAEVADAIDAYLAFRKSPS